MRRSIPAAALLACALTASAATATTPEDVARDPGFEAMLARVDAAQLEHLRYVPPGQAEPVTRETACP